MLFFLKLVTSLQQMQTVQCRQDLSKPRSTCSRGGCCSASAHLGFPRLKTGEHTVKKPLHLYKKVTTTQLVIIKNCALGKILLLIWKEKSNHPHPCRIYAEARNILYAWSVDVQSLTSAYCYIMCGESYFCPLWAEITTWAGCLCVEASNDQYGVMDTNWTTKGST